MKTDLYSSPRSRLALLSLGVAVAVLILLFGLSGCVVDSCETTTTYITFRPEFAPMSELRQEVGVRPSQEIKNPGKIYAFGNYLLVGEPGSGIHVYDNSDKANPRPVSFVSIPGNMDMAIRGNRLYADNYLDLVVFDFSNPHHIVVVDRVENAFPNYNEQFGVYNVTGQVVVNMVQVEEVELTTDCSRPVRTMFFDNNNGVVFMQADVFNSRPSGTGNLTGPLPTGTGGSMARFAIVGDYLYTVDFSLLHVFSLASPDLPQEISLLDLGWGIETLFPYQDKLFIGSQSGMFLYGLNNPAEPEYLSEVRHITACDPVVANERYAFVTLRSQEGFTPCGTGFANQLDVIDVSDPANARLLHTFSMESPYGLGLADSLLFVTEGDAGLKVFHINPVSRIDRNMLQHITGVHAYDVIPIAGTLILTGRQGIYQYDYSDPRQLKELSVIPVLP